MKVGFVFYVVFYVSYLTLEIRSFLIEKIKNNKIYRDLTFTNRKEVIKNDWDSMLYGGLIQRSPLLFSLIKWNNIIFIICLPVLSGMLAIGAFGFMPAHTTEEARLNFQLLRITVVACYIFSFMVMIFHTVNLKKYNDIADQQKAIEESKQILKG